MALCLNPDSGNVSAQYHVVFDEKFTTVSTEPEEDPLTRGDIEELFDSGHFRHEALDEIDFDEIDEDQDDPTGSLHDPHWHLSLPPDFDHSVFRNPGESRSRTAEEANDSEEPEDDQNRTDTGSFDDPDITNNDGLPNDGNGTTMDDDDEEGTSIPDPPIGSQESS